jgi:hypothetical protein
MAQPIQRIDDSSTTIQPTPGTSPVDVQAEQALANQQGRSATATGEIAGQVQQFSANIMRDEALKMAQRDAAKSVTVDADGKPVYSEESKGWGGLVYNKAFDEAAFATYRTAAVADINRRVDAALIKNPANPAAVFADLQPYVDETLKNMPAHFADQLRPQFSGILNGARQSAQAGKARADIAGITATLPADEQQIVLDRSNVLFSGKDRTANDANFQKILDDHRKKLSQSGMQPDQIEDKIDFLAKAAEVHKVGKQISATIAASAPGDNAQGAALHQIEEILKTPGYSRWATEFRTILNGYAGRGGTISQSAQAAQAHAIGQKAAGHDLAARAIATNPDLDEQEKARELSALNTRKSMDMFGLSNTQKLQILTAGAGVVENSIAATTQQGAEFVRQTNAGIQSSYQAAASTALNNVQHGATRAIKDQGYADLGDIISSSYVNDKARTDPVYAQMLSAAQRGRAEHTAEALTFDRAQAWHRVKTGQVDPRFHDEIFREAIDTGAIGGAGGITTGEALANMAEGEQNFIRGKQMRAHAAAGYAAVAKGDIPSPMQVKAMEALARDPNGLGLPSGVPAGPNTKVNSQGIVSAAPVALTPTDMKTLHEHVASKSYVPKEYVELLQAQPDTINRDDQKIAVGMVRGTMDIWRKLHGGKHGDDVLATRNMVWEMALSTFGADVMENVDTYEKGYASENGATPEQIKKGRERNARNRDMSAADNDKLTQLSQINAKVNDAMANPDGLLASWNRASISWFGLMGPEWNMRFPEFQNEGTRKLLGSKLPAGTTGESLYGSPDFQKEYVDYKTNYYDPKFKAINDKHGFQNEEQAMLSFINQFKDRISSRVEKDPSSGKDSTVLFLDGYNQTLRNKHGISWDDKTLNIVTESALTALHPDKAALAIPGTMEVTGVRARDGKMLYKASMKAYGGQAPIEFGYVDPEDKRWPLELGPMATAIAKQMDVNSQGLGGLFTKLWTLQFNRPEYAAELAAKMVDLSDRSKDPSQTWVDIVRWTRSVVGTIQGVDDEMWDRMARPAFAQAMREHGVISVINQGAQPDKRRLYATTTPSYKAPPDVSAPYPAQQIPPEVLAEQAAIAAARTAEERKAATTRPGRPQPTVPFGSVKKP